MAKEVFPPSEDKFLGKVMDRVLAQKLGISARTVYRRRVLLGIEKPPRFQPLTAAEKRIASKLDRASAAADVGISVAAAKAHRREKGIKDRVRVRAKPKPFPDSAIKLLATTSNAKLAARYGCRLEAVAEARANAGLPVFKRRLATPKLTRSFARSLANDSVRTVAAKYGMSEAAIAKLRRRAGLAKWNRLPASQLSALGRLSDAAYAKKFGVPVETARIRRHNLAIDPQFAEQIRALLD